MNWYGYAGSNKECSVKNNFSLNMGILIIRQLNSKGSYLLDGRYSISNIAAKNTINPFTVGLKNWLFADTPKGTTTSVVKCSIVEIAKANELNIFT